MQLLEINYSKKLDTFTGYLANGSDYFRYEVDRDGVELTRIDEVFEDREDFSRKILGRNPRVTFLADPIKVREINYRELESYKRLALPARSGQQLAVRPTTILLLLLLAGLLYYAYTLYSEKDPGEGTMLLRPDRMAVEKEVHYHYKIHLVGGGTLEGTELKQDDRKVLVKNRQGLEVMMELSKVAYIEKIQRDNPLSRSVIFGVKP